MNIPGISQLWKAIKVQPDLKRAAQEMAAHPELARSRIGALVNIMNTEALAHGAGFVGRDGQIAGACLRLAVADGDPCPAGSAASEQNFARQLQYLGSLKQNYVAQKGMPGASRGHDHVIEKLIVSIEGLENFRGPRGGGAGG